MACGSCGSTKNNKGSLDISLARTLKEGVKNFPRVARQLVNKQFVTQAVKEERLSKCRACPNFISSNKRCYVCTCYLDRKTLLSCEYCPINVWGIEGTECEES